MVKRKIIQNNHQYRLNIPIELVRKLGLDKGGLVVIKEAKTSQGEGLVILKDEDEVLEVEDLK